jgi:hypothetical protein
MPTISLRVPLLVLGVASAAALGGYVAWVGGPGQPALAAQKPAAGPTKLYFGSEACIECHSEGARAKQALLCRCTEVQIWEKDDKHRDAYKVLLGERAKRMEELLSAGGEKWNVATDSRCVGCHGVVIEDEKLKHVGPGGFKLEEGVSCVACHGPYRDWVEFHGAVLRRKDWRALTRKEKEEKYGMTDLWDPARRAQLCMSCHLGNAEKGWFVTHDMYAAGHPPLPAIEVAAFSEQMPRHWEYLKEKSPEVQKLLNVDPQEARFEQTRLVVTSALVGLRETMKLLGSQTAEANGAGWPELGQFDCYACHHDLKTPSWRQQRGYVGKPGRPQMRPWSPELAGLGLRAAGEDPKGLATRLTDIYRAFDAQPFGVPRAINASARKTVDWTDELLRKVAAQKFDDGTVRALLRGLCTPPRDDLPDYDSARQIAWAIRTIYGELYGPAKPANDAKIQELFARLDKQLQLQLPSGQNRSIEKELKENLKRRNEYDPQQFKQALQELRALLPDA